MLAALNKSVNTGYKYTVIKIFLYDKSTHTRQLLNASEIYQCSAFRGHDTCTMQSIWHTALHSITQHYTASQYMHSRSCKLTLSVGEAVATMWLHALHENSSVLGSRAECTTTHSAHKTPQMVLQLQGGDCHHWASAKWPTTAGTQLKCTSSFHSNDWLWAITGDILGSPGVGSSTPFILPSALLGIGNFLLEGRL